QKALRELPETQLINGYGPTENTTFTCCFAVPQDWEGGRSVPIGKPISNTEVYVVDNLLQPVPIGVPGELIISGDGLAREYLKAPELTSQKYVWANLGAGQKQRCYRTGDRVRWLPDGNLEFLGRLDTQVKIRGFRIELSEIETVLAEDPAIEQCIVVAREDSTKTRQLLGYVVFKTGTTRTCSELREFLAARLPSYMVPSSFVSLSTLPLNSSGKVDRKNLPEGELLTSNEASARPATDTEQAIASIWSEVLDVQNPGRADNFFESGGHSLLATRVISRVNQVFNRNLPLRTLFEAPTIAGLAKAVSESQQNTGANHPLIRRVRRVRVEAKQTSPEEQP
ncbi:MAG: non-ribosomal peptide synthetase, partial [Limisphaerales bacterium]